MTSPTRIPRRVAAPLHRVLEHQNSRFHSDLVDAVDAIFLLETVAGGNTGRGRRSHDIQKARTPQEQATWCRLENDTLSLASNLRDTRPVAAKSDLIYAFPPQFSASRENHMQETTALVEAAAPALARRFAEAERHFLKLDAQDDEDEGGEDAASSTAAAEHESLPDDDEGEPDLSSLNPEQLSHMLKSLVDSNQSIKIEVDALTREGEALALAQRGREAARKSEALGWAAQPPFEIPLTQSDGAISSVEFWRTLLAGLESDLEADERSRAVRSERSAAARFHHHNNSHASSLSAAQPNSSPLSTSHEDLLRGNLCARSLKSLDRLFSDDSTEAFLQLRAFADYADMTLRAGFR